MIFVNMVLDNKFASDMSPESFVKMRYLTALAKADLVNIEVKQGEMVSTVSPKDCDTCIFDDRETNMEPCVTCLRIDNPGKWKSEEAEELRVCNTCGRERRGKYCEECLFGNEEQHYHKHWQPKEN